MNGNWMMEFSIDMDTLTEGKLVAVTSENKELLQVLAGREGITAKIHTCWESNTEHFGKNPEFTFTLISPKMGKQIRLCWQEFSFRLYVDGELEDEELP